MYLYICAIKMVYQDNELINMFQTLTATLLQNPKQVYEIIFENRIDSYIGHIVDNEVILKK
jgi:hypothetical protein